MKKIPAYVLGAILLSSCSQNDEPKIQTPVPQTSSQTVQSSIQTVASSSAPSMESCSNVQGYATDVEFKPIPSQKTNMLFVTFIGKHPPASEIDKILRACLSAASSLDSKWAILGNALLRASSTSNPNDDENIRVYEPLEYLSFDPADKTIAVRKMNFGK